MNNTEQLTQFALQQHFDDHWVQIFETLCTDVGINNLPQTTVEQGNCLLLLLKHNQATPEFVKNLLGYSLQKGMPLSVIDHILNSDLDKDGRALSQELFEDYTDPFEKEAGEQGAGGRGDGSGGDSTPPEREPLNRSGGLRPMFRSAPQQKKGVISPCSLPPSPCLFVEVDSRPQMCRNSRQIELEL
jgi:hypothetical protein